MPISPARRISYQILLRLESGRDFAVDRLQRAEVSALKEVDRRLATEIVMGVLRWRGELDFQIDRLAGKHVKKFDDEVRTILRMGVYQVRFLEKTPKHAVVDDAVELTKLARKRSAAGLVNAVLRKLEPVPSRGRGDDFESLSATSRDSVRRSYPEWLLKRWEGIRAATGSELGQAGATRLAYAGLRTPPVTLRVVDAHADMQGVRSELAAEGVTTSLCRYATDHGLTVVSGQVQSTRAYQSGRLVIQDEASQLVAELVLPDSGMRVLDLCAAPGIKAGQLAQRLGAGTLVACDRSRSRLRTLSKLLPSQVPPGVRLLIATLDAALPLPFAVKFDRILLDAPCSGTGTLGRNPETKWRLQPEDIARLAELQKKMLRNALATLARGGRLVYATCSLEPEENEGVVHEVLSQQPEFRALTGQELAPQYPHWASLFDARGYFRTRPDRDLMDGFAAAVIVRVADRN